MKKRILVISQHFWPENFRISDIATGFVENDIEVDVLCGIPNYPNGIMPEGYGWFKNKKQDFVGKTGLYMYHRASLVAQLVKNPPAIRETWVQSLGWGDPLEKRTHSSILAWKIPWTV